MRLVANYMRVVSATLSIGVPLSLSAPVTAQASLPGNNLSLDDLVATARSYGSFKPRTRFDQLPPGPAWDGKRFSLTISPEERVFGNRSVCSGFPEWQYTEGELSAAMFSYDIIGYHFMGEDGPIFTQSADLAKGNILRVTSVACTRSIDAKATASNALGTKFPITKIDDSIIGIADTGPFDFKFRQFWSQKITGDDARALAQHLRIRLSGKLTSWLEGRSIVCGTSFSDASISIPVETTVSACLYHGRVDTFEVIDGESGAVIFTETRKLK